VGDNFPVRAVVIALVVLLARRLWPRAAAAKACIDADECSPAGPETCGSGPAPSFDPQASATQGWCLLTCRSDADCRTAEGYRCVGVVDSFGLCEVP